MINFLQRVFGSWCTWDLLHRRPISLPTVISVLFGSLHSHSFNEQTLQSSQNGASVFLGLRLVRSRLHVCCPEQTNCPRMSFKLQCRKILPHSLWCTKGCHFSTSFSLLLAVNSPSGCKCIDNTIICEGWISHLRNLKEFRWMQFNWSLSWRLYLDAPGQETFHHQSLMYLIAFD